MISFSPLYLFTILSLLSLTAGISYAGDIPGSSDHPVISRYEGSVIKVYGQNQFDEYTLPLGKVIFDPYPEVVPENMKDLEGKVTRITYLNPEGRSTLEVFRNYEKGLGNDGFEILYVCNDEACGGRAMNHAVVPEEVYLFAGENYKDQRFLAARLEREEGDIFAALYVNRNAAGKVYTQLDIIEVKPMQEGMVAVEADAMEKQIISEGSISIYGIYFDFDSADVKESSKPSLEQIGKLLKQNPGLKLFVVGHTDNEGTLEYNIGLSMKRASSVTKKLINEYDIDPERLTPRGLGPLAPVASNRTEEGRKMNRRVQLVEQ